MKRIDECTDMTVLVALLVVGILLVMGPTASSPTCAKMRRWTPGPSCWGRRACCWQWWAFCWPAAASGGSSTCGTTRNKQDHNGTPRSAASGSPVYLCRIITDTYASQKEKLSDGRIVFYAKGLYNGEKFADKIRKSLVSASIFSERAAGCLCRGLGHKPRRAKRTA